MTCRAFGLAVLLAIPVGEVWGALLSTTSISSTNPSPVDSGITLDIGGRYLLEASGVYAWGDPLNPNPVYLGDPAYSTLDGWVNLRTDTGIRPTAPEIHDPALGVLAMLVDFGSGPEVIDWGDYNAAHIYQYTFTATAPTVGFVISDWLGPWPAGNYPDFCQDQGCMYDNRGGLSVALYSLSPIPEPPTLALFGLGLAGLGAIRRRKLPN
jgi:hypothetical protein